ncbi:type II toxin-antitoxin system YafQ family toxin [Succinivibrio dextrinosolvens]|nr:type II toxin-antitoxin system YafQ family toxin [Succinivibrio dextrinosolvens]
MYTIYFTKKMKKDLKLMKKRGKDISMLTDVLDILSCGQKLAERYREHQL